MPNINDNYLKLKAGYLFPEIGRRVKAFAAEHPGAKIIRMGIGDVTEPLVPAIIQAMHKAVDEMADRATFKGYGDEQGYGFLREAVAKPRPRAACSTSTPGRSSTATPAGTAAGRAMCRSCG